MIATIFELADDALTPVLEAVPERPYPAAYFRPDVEIDLMSLAKDSATDPDSLGDVAERYAGWVASMSRAGMLGEDGKLNTAGQAALEALFHARLRVVCTGVFSELEHPLDVRIYADVDYAFLMRHHHDGALGFSYGPLHTLSEMLGKMVPERPAGTGPLIHMDVEEDGKIPAEREADLRRIRQNLALPRLGTLNFDISMSETVFVEHPKRTFAWVDNEHGRYVLSNMWHSSGKWHLMHGPSGLHQLQTIIQGAVSELDDEFDLDDDDEDLDGDEDY